MNRKKACPYTNFLERIPRNIESVLRKESPLTPGIISKRTGYHWLTVKKYLELLEREGIVEGRRVGRVFLYAIREGLPP